MRIAVSFSRGARGSFFTMRASILRNRRPATTRTAG
jgi:hypothetical protein